MTLSIFLLYLICLIVGILVGSTGMGGILIPPSLVLLSGLETHVAMGTTLASFMPMDLVGCVTFRRMNHLPWDKAWPITLGGALSAGPFALINTNLSGNFLTFLLALLILFAGYRTFKPVKVKDESQESFWLTTWGLFWIGAITGTVAGLTGAGGPLLAIAWMVTYGLHPLTAIGLSMPYSVSTAITATICNHLNGNIDFICFAKVSLVELIGFGIGVLTVSKMPVAIIKRIMGITCVGLGLFLVFKSLIWQI